MTFSSVKSSAKKVTAKYKKATGASGYQIAYSIKKRSGFKTVTTTAALKILSGLTSKKTYYVKVRAYKTVSGKKYYGAYLSIKSVKVK